MKLVWVSFFCGLFLLDIIAVSADRVARTGSGAREVQFSELKVNPNPPAIHAAAANNNIDELKKILKEEDDAADMADPFNGWRPLHYAAFGNSINAAKLLILNKASVNLGNGAEMLTSLHIASIRNNTEMVQFLLEQGASQNQRNASGLTAFHLAVLFNSQESAKMLLAGGAGVAIKDNNGAGSWDILMACRQRLIVQAEKKVRLEIPPPQLSGKELCSYCDGTGRLSPAEVRRLASETAAATIGSGRSVKTDIRCRNCSGTGYIMSYSDRMALERYEVNISRRAFSLVPDTRSLQDALTAFGANPSIPNAHIQPKWSELKAKITEEYDPHKWRRDLLPATSQLPTPASATSQPTVGDGS